MPKITQDGPSTSPADARVTETDDPAVLRDMHAREMRTHAAENVGLRRENEDLQRRLDEATLSAAERDKQNDDAETKEAKTKSGREPGAVIGDADDESTGTKSGASKATGAKSESGKSGTFKLDSDK